MWSFDGWRQRSSGQRPHRDLEPNVDNCLWLHSAGADAMWNHAPVVTCDFKQRSWLRYFLTIGRQVMVEGGNALASFSLTSFFSSITDQPPSSFWHALFVLLAPEEACNLVSSWVTRALATGMHFTPQHLVILHGLPLCGSVAVSPKRFQIAIIPFKDDHGISGKEKVSQTDLLQRRHPFTVLCCNSASS